MSTSYGREDGSTSQRKKWVLNQQAFDKLLACLDADRNRAGKKYEEIRLKLIKVFVRRRCNIAEELADETINRVAKKLLEKGDNYIDDLGLYIYGVAKNVYLEYVKRRPERLPVAPPDPAEEVERNCECLDRCMKCLNNKDRELILEYYRGEKQAKIEHRRELAERLGIGLNTLRIRVHRIKASLEGCVGDCLKQTCQVQSSCD